jgi:hypothetical protein
MQVSAVACKRVNLQLLYITAKTSTHDLHILPEGVTTERYITTKNREKIV